MKKHFSLLLLIFFTTFNFSLFAQNVSVTLMVDMQNQTVSNSGVFVAGGFNSWSTNTTSLSDIDGDQVYEVTLNLSSNSGHEFKFINGSSWENNLSGSCANNFGSGPNRWLSVGTINQVEPAYQFGSCNVVVFYGCTDSLANNFNPNATNDDGSCDYTIFGCTDSLANNYSPLATSDDSSCTYDIVVTFNVDMSNESISNNGVHLAGSFNGWSTDSTEMFDLDGDSIYSTSILLNQNTYYEYKFINGNSWGSDELLASWESCSNMSGNRVLNTSSSPSENLGIVCFGSCAICPIYGCTDSSAYNYNSSANTDDGTCILTCLSPTNLSLQSRSDKIAWVMFDEMSSSFDSVVTYKILYKAISDTTWLIKQKNYAGNQTPTSKIRLQNLLPSTNYEMKIKAFYTSGCISDFSGISYFNTEDLCPNVTNLRVSSPKSNKALFEWDTNGVYSFVRLKYRVDSISNPTSADWKNIGGFGVNFPLTQKLKSGLTAGQTYRAQARTWCDPNGGPYKSSSWTSLIFWTQPSSIRFESNYLNRNSLEIFPNPSNDIFNIHTKTDLNNLEKIEVYNSNGKLIKSLNKFSEKINNNIVLNLSNFPKGLYSIKLIYDDNYQNRKIVLQ